MKTISFFFCLIVFSTLAFAQLPQEDKRATTALLNYRNHLAKHLPKDHPVPRRVDLAIKLVRGVKLTTLELKRLEGSIDYGDLDYLPSKDPQREAERVRLGLARFVVKQKLEIALAKGKS